jgi:phage shock protein A
VSAISGFCEKCNKFRKRHCDGNRNTCMSILFDTIEALQAENEQLQAQVAELRDSLKWLKSISFSHEDDLEQWPSQETREPIEHALSNSMGVDYHNPADVEALRKAREALYAARVDVLTKETDELARDAVEAIDALIGGKEDEETGTTI